MYIQLQLVSQLINQSSIQNTVMQLHMQQTNHNKSFNMSVRVTQNDQ